MSDEKYSRILKPNIVPSKAIHFSPVALVLKATQENGQTNTVTGFKVDLTNVIPV
ncbi:MAG: hypothetical protein M3297_06375 [Thermoproteota archaeon]|nr:hypothetical protein [Thermoproteota archaeon]